MYYLHTISQFLSYVNCRIFELLGVLERYYSGHQDLRCKSRDRPRWPALHSLHRCQGDEHGHAEELVQPRAPESTVSPSDRITHAGVGWLALSYLPIAALNFPHSGCHRIAVLIGTSARAQQIPLPRFPILGYPLRWALDYSGAPPDLIFYGAPTLEDSPFPEPCEEYRL